MSFLLVLVDIWKRWNVYFQSKYSHPNSPAIWRNKMIHHGYQREKNRLPTDPESLRTSRISVLFVHHVVYSWYESVGVVDIQNQPSIVVMKWIWKRNSYIRCHFITQIAHGSAATIFSIAEKEKEENVRIKLSFVYWIVSEGGVTTFIVDDPAAAGIFNWSCAHMSSSCLFCMRMTTATDVHGKIPNSVITALINVGGVTS